MGETVDNPMLAKLFSAKISFVGEIVRKPCGMWPSVKSSVLRLVGT
jgi:hypothetical protein